jgi:hypothetical protein
MLATHIRPNQTMEIITHPSLTHSLMLSPEIVNEERKKGIFHHPSRSIPQRKSNIIYVLHFLLSRWII